MSTRWRRIGAVLTVVAMLACVVPTVAIPLGHDSLEGIFTPYLGAAIFFAVVGAFLLWRGAVASIAVIMCVQGVCNGLDNLLGVVANVAAESGPLRGVPLWALWLEDFLWLPGFMLLTPLVLLFPDGRMAPGRWRWLLVAVGIVTIYFLLTPLITEHGLVQDEPYEFAPSPTGFIKADLVFQIGGKVGFIALVLTLLASIWSLVSRRRRTSGVVRAQLTCVLYGAVITAAALVVLVVVNSSDPIVLAVATFSVAPLAIGIAVAVLRYRLYDIDKVVSRTVSYALVLLVLAGLYVGIVVGIANVLPHHNEPVWVAVATLSVSIVAVPLTRRVRRAVDRRFNRSRFDAERVVAAFAARLRARPERGDVPADLLEVVHRTVAPAHAGVWLVPSGSRR